MLFIKPYRMSSRSAKLLQDACKNEGVRCLRSRRRGTQWGSAIDKVTQFRKFKERGVASVPFTEDIEDAQEWLNNGQTVVVRHMLSSHSGRGIEIIEPGMELSEARLYTMYKKKKAEYRVHVCYGDTLIQRKLKKSGWDDFRDTRIRNLGNGYIFAFNCLISDSHRERLSTLGVEAVRALQLDMGAADVIYNEREDTFYVLEVNTAPGLSSRTAIFYAKALIRNCNRSRSHE